MSRGSPYSEVIEPEVLPPAPARAPVRPRRSLRARLRHALGPVLAGLALDLVDFATFGPIGLVLGPFIGGGVGWYLSGLLRLNPRQRLITAILSGIYCMIPFTEFVPVGTLVGAFARFQEED